MKIFIAFALSAVWPVAGFASQTILGPLECGHFQRAGEKWVFVEEAPSKLEAAVQFWGVIESELKPHLRDPDKKILSGSMGSTNTGGLLPHERIRIFIENGEKGATLVGMTDANGKFAVSLPAVEAGTPQYVFFSGEVEIVPDSGKLEISSDLDPFPVLRLKAGTRTLRYRVHFPKP